MVDCIMLDTSAVIELVKRNNPKILDALKSEMPTAIAISGITQFELEVGAKDEEDLKKIRSIPCISADCPAFSIAAHIYAELKSAGKTPQIKDCFIAAVAIYNDCLLMTFDRDFGAFEKFGLKTKLLN